MKKLLVFTEADAVIILVVTGVACLLLQELSLPAFLGAALGNRLAALV
jgi:hypothetical protein